MMQRIKIYIRLLRLEDQYTVAGIIIAAAIILRLHTMWIFFWIAGCTLLQISAFILNEMVDFKDTDKFSWNKNHIKRTDKLNPKIVWSLYGLFSLSGLILAGFSKMFWWGFEIYILWVCYSLKPIRLKARFIFDILTQTTAGLAIPFMAPFIVSGNIPRMLLPTIVLIPLIWFCIYPYQLADYRADLKARIKPTHIILGMKACLWLNLIFVLYGIVAFILLRVDNIAPWAWIIIPFAIYVLYENISWIKFNSIAEQVNSLQNYVRLVKPLSILILPFLLIIWIIFYVLAP